MAYIGRGLDKLSNVDVLDAITFTNSAGPYNILKGGVAFIPSAIQNLLIEVDGIIQASASYTISGSTITFGVSMPSTSTMNSMIHFGTGLITTPADGTVTTAKIVDDAVTTAKILNANVTNAKLGTDISADKLVAGTVTDARLPTTMAGKTLTTANVSATTLTAAGDGSSADGKITLNCSQNTHGVKIQSPSHASAQTYTLTLPTTAPVADRILQTDGSGNLSFAEVSGGTSWQTVVTASTLTAVAGNGYPINTTSNACTVTLPASASVGDTIEFTDYARNWGTNALTINQNSLKYQGNATPNPVYDTDGESVSITYMDATQGWIPTNDGAVALETSQAYNLEYLVIGGGGGGSRAYAGAGGAGGYRNSYASETSGGGGSTETPLSVTPASVLTIDVGGGGAGSAVYGTPGTVGEESSIKGTGIDITSDGGGYGGPNTDDGGDGGSGGGGGSGATSGGSATTNQGYDGGSSTGASGWGAAGGGGAAAVGGSHAGTTDTGGNGGAGLNSDITGSTVGRAGGGGGGSGGGGTRGSATHGGGSNANGTANTGGGGSGSNSSGVTWNGGSGVVILRIATADYSGTSSGAETPIIDGSDTILVFNGDGSYTP